MYNPLRHNRQLVRGQSETLQMILCDQGDIIQFGLTTEGGAAVYYQGFELNMEENTVKGVRGGDEIFGGGERDIWDSSPLPGCMRILNVTVTNMGEDPIEYTIGVPSGPPA